MADREVGDVPGLERRKGRAYAVASMAAEHGIYLAKSDCPYVSSAFERNLLEDKGF